MKQEMVTITKEEYNKLKKLEEIDHELIESFKRSFEDAIHGRIRRVA